MTLELLMDFVVRVFECINHYEAGHKELGCDYNLPEGLRLLTYFAKAITDCGTGYVCYSLMENSLVSLTFE